MIVDSNWSVNEPRIRIYKNATALNEASLVEAVCPIGTLPNQKVGYS